MYCVPVAFPRLWLGVWRWSCWVLWVVSMSHVVPVMRGRREQTPSHAAHSILSTRDYPAGCRPRVTPCVVARPGMWLGCCTLGKILFFYKKLTVKYSSLDDSIIYFFFSKLFGITILFLFRCKLVMYLCSYLSSMFVKFMTTTVHKCMMPSYILSTY